MTARKKKIKPINLLPQEEFASSTAGRILTWVLSAFRVIVILVEMVVMIAFLSRFWLDAKASTLADEIERNEAIVESFSNFEEEFRATQQKIKVFSEFTQKGPVYQLLDENITPYLPEGVSLTFFSVSENEVTLKGSSISEKSIAQFVENIRSTGVLKNVSLNQVATVEDSIFILFSMSANLGGQDGN